MANRPNLPAAPETPAPPPGVLVSDYYREPYGYACFRAAGTKDWLLMYTISGKGIVRSGARAYECVSGDAVILPPGTPHDYRTADGNVWEKIWCHFLPRPTWVSWLKPPKMPNPVLHTAVTDPAMRERIHDAVRRLLDYCRLLAAGELRNELALNALEEAILLLAAQRTPARSPSLDPRIQQVLSLMKQHIAHPFRIEELARSVCLSPSRLVHLFKEQVGDSIIETLLKFRLKQAEQLLLSTSRQIAEIAADVGFSTPDYFTRKFSQYYGMNPTMYRKNAAQPAGGTSRDESGNPLRDPAG